MGSKIYMQKERWLLSSFCLAHFLVLALKKFSPHNLTIQKMFNTFSNGQLIDNNYYRFISLTTSILNFSAYISANCFNVNAHPCRPDPKPTLPLLGSTYKREKMLTRYYIVKLQI